MGFIDHIDRREANAPNTLVLGAVNEKSLLRFLGRNATGLKGLRMHTVTPNGARSQSPIGPKIGVIGASLGTFTILPNSLLLSPDFRELSGDAAKLLVMLWWHVQSDDDLKEVWCKNPRMAALINCESPTTVKKYVDELICSGLVQEGPGVRNVDERGRPRRSLYLMTPGVQRIAPQPKHRNQEITSPRENLDQKITSQNKPVCQEIAEKGAPIRMEPDRREPDENSPRCARSSGSSPLVSPASGSLPKEQNEIEQDERERQGQEPNPEKPEEPIRSTCPEPTTPFMRLAGTEETIQAPVIPAKPFQEGKDAAEDRLWASWKSLSPEDQQDAVKRLAVRFRSNSIAIARLTAVQKGEQPSLKMIQQLIEAMRK